MCKSFENSMGKEIKPTVSGSVTVFFFVYHIPAKTVEMFAYISIT
jgi:hypothetical protein